MDDSNVKKILSVVDSKIKREMDVDIGRAFNSLFQKEVRPRLPENIFANVFLPYFINSKPVDDNSDVLVNWIAIAGTPTNKVDIIDQNNNVLFTVPPLIDSDLMSAKIRGPNFNDIIRAGRQESSRLPGLGDDFVVSVGTARIKALERSHVSNYAKEWDVIRKYYKLDGGTTTTTASAIEKKIDDEYDY